MLPRVKIHFDNGALGSVSPSDDGVVGLIASATAVNGKFALKKAYLITKFDDLADLGITEASNANKAILKCVEDFYTDALEGTKLWIMGVEESVLASEIVDKNNDYAKALLIAAKGAINVLVIKKTSIIAPTVTDSLDADVPLAIGKAQQLAEWATESLFAPCIVLVEGRYYDGQAAALKPLYECGYNRVVVVLGDTVPESTGAAVGLVAGRIAAIPVQRSIARVKSGAIESTVMYIGAKEAENGQPDIISDAGYICPRTFVGKAGYYWSDDKLSAVPTDDYALIPRRRVIDKAYRIAYQTLVNELGDEIPVTADGNIPLAVCKSIQDTVETAIITSMGGAGNLGTDPEDATDTGVVCYIDPNQNIVSTSAYNVTLKIRPYGYAKYIDVNLGFQTVNP